MSRRTVAMCSLYGSEMIKQQRERERERECMLNTTTIKTFLHTGGYNLPSAHFETKFTDFTYQFKN